MTEVTALTRSPSRTWLRIADDPAGNAAGQLLEHHLTALCGPDDGAAVLVFLRSLGLEGKHMFTGIIIREDDVAGHRPEIRVEIPEIHIHGDHQHLAPEIAGFPDGLDVGHLAIGHGGDYVVVAHGFPVGDHMEISLPAGHPEQGQRQQYFEPPLRHKTKHDGNQHGADQVDEQDRSVGIAVEFHNRWKRAR